MFGHLYTEGLHGVLETLCHASRNLMLITRLLKSSTTIFKKVINNILTIKKVINDADQCSYDGALPFWKLTYVQACRRPGRDAAARASRDRPGPPPAARRGADPVGSTAK